MSRLAIIFSPLCLLLAALAAGAARADGPHRTRGYADGVATTYQYHPDGSLHHTLRTLPGNRTLVTTREYGYEHNDLQGGTERGSRVEKTYLQTAAQPPPSVLLPVTTTRTRGDGFASKTTTIATGDTLTHTTLPDATSSWTETTTYPDSTKTLTTYANGLPLTESLLDSSTPGSTLHTTTYAHDSLGRVLSVDDSRTGTTSYDEHDDGQADMTPSGNLLYIREPSATGQPLRITRMAYDPLGRRTTLTLPDNTQTHTTYDLAGSIRSQWGSQTYPQRFAHDQQGRLRTLETWRANAPTGDPSLAPGGDVTTWHYDPAGRLAAKEDAQHLRTDYAHTPAGRLDRRQWARNAPGTNTRLTTEYGYTNGFLTDVDYNDATPDVTLSYDDLGRPDTVSNTVATTAYSYAPDLGVDTETITYQLPNQPAFTRVLDRATRSLGRDTGWQLLNNSTIENAATYAYHATEGRLEEVIGLGAQEFTYGYLPQSSLIQTVTGPAHTVTNTWEEHRDLLLAKTNHLGNPTAPISKFNYDIPLPGGDPSGLGANLIRQREKVLTTGTAFNGTPANWTWDYDSMGQLTTAAASTPANSRAYQYDAIGNRRFSEFSNSQISNPPQADTTAYTTNSLNQYTAISGGGFQPQSPTYDLDGNMESGPVLPEGATIPQDATLAWDAENRLTKATAGSTTVQYTYDAFSRLISRGVGVAPTGYTYYLHDGWNRIAEYSGNNLQRTYLWGTDLSGTLQGAGGVGGLLAVRHFFLPLGEGQGEGQSKVFYPCFDGNGNISEYLDEDGEPVAHFEYDPFGNLTEDSFNNAGDFPYRFSTKPSDSATGLLYYGLRWYSPPNGRWPSRDPIAEEGGLNLYGFMGNNGVDRIDFLGLEDVVPKKQGPLAKCNYWIMAGHRKEAMLEMLRNKLKKAPPGTRLAALCCNSSWVNRMLKTTFGEHAVIPGVGTNDDDLWPDDLHGAGKVIDEKGEVEGSKPMFLHKHRRVTPALVNAITTSVKAAMADCDAKKCKIIHVTVHCLGDGFDDDGKLAEPGAMRASLQRVGNERFCGKTVKIHCKDCYGENSPPKNLVEGWQIRKAVEELLEPTATPKNYEADQNLRLEDAAK